MFRFRNDRPTDYWQQGYAYFVSHRYAALSEERRQQIDALCRECGGEYAEALHDYMTRDLSAAAVCRKHFISERTLMRAVNRYYLKFTDSL